jgi:hypothetical protein
MGYKLVPYGFKTAIKNKLFRPSYPAKEKGHVDKVWVVGGAHFGCKDVCVLIIADKCNCN